MPSVPFRLAALAALALLPTPGAAQTPDAVGVAVYRYVPVGRPSMAVDVWGSVRQPGRYVVEAGQSLLDVLALAGGPGVADGDDLAARTATVSVARGDGADRAVAVRLTLDDLAGGAAVPVLADGDLVVVRTVGAGRIAVPVDVWGAVRQPGRYDVTPGTGLLDVLTLAGGPNLATEDNRVVRTARVALSRADGGARRVVFEGTLEDLVARTSPAVEEGDLVTVRLLERQRFGWRDALTVASGAASLALVLLRIADRAP